MAHFYGTMKGNKGVAIRCGTEASGMVITCVSWKGAVECRAYVDNEGKDCVRVEKVLWQGVGENKVLYDGPIGKEKS